MNKSNDQSELDKELNEEESGTLGDPQEHSDSSSEAQQQDDKKLSPLFAAEAEDDDYDYPVGDGYLGVVIEMRKNGELIDTLHPGILRFDSPSSQVTPRSEPDRHVGLFGDTIIILDIFQSDDLLDAMMFRETSEVDRIRVTVHDLQGSHAVWFGWILIIIGGGLAYLSSPRISRQD